MNYDYLLFKQTDRFNNSKKKCNPNKNVIIEDILWNNP